MSDRPLSAPSRAVTAAVLLAALGYFVDIYDLILFSIVRLQSLKDIGVPEVDRLSQGVFLLNMQMTGMLLGGILWGVLGDRRGRLSVLFGSIVLYSIANIANAFVHSVDAYAAWRLVAGIGLAGELGAGVTLVSEVMSKETRGYGTMIVAAVGIMGAIAAGVVGARFDWRVAYIVGGVLGFLLLFLRIGVYESGMFEGLKRSGASRGNLLLLLQSPQRFLTYLRCILVGVPIWFVIGIPVTFSPEIGKALHMDPLPNPGKAVMWCYGGLVVGDFASGWLSQRLKSRKKVLLLFVLLTVGATAVYLLQHSPSLDGFHALCFILGVAGGYWAVFVTVAAEQFGTNIRATVATTTPNFVRGAVVPMTASFRAMAAPERLGVLKSAGTVGAVVLGLALLSLWGLKETYGKDLDFVES